MVDGAGVLVTADMSYECTPGRLRLMVVHDHLHGGNHVHSTFSCIQQYASMYEFCPHAPSTTVLTFPG